MHNTKESNIRLVPNTRGYLEIIQNVKRRYQIKTQRDMALRTILASKVAEGVLSDYHRRIVMNFYEGLEYESETS